MEKEVCKGQPCLTGMIFPQAQFRFLLPIFIILISDTQVEHCYTDITEV